jgi:hypothetical protein
MPLVIPPLGAIHVPSGDDPDNALALSLEDNHEEATRTGRAKGCVVAPFRLPEDGADGEDLLGLFHPDPVTKREM